VVGVGFIAAGILGFVPGATTDYDAMELAGNESGSALLGVLQVSVLHNVVHLLFGVLGMLLARSIATARLYLVGGGATYLVLWLYGLVIDRASDANFVPMNDADNWLHLVLGLSMVGLGLVVGSKREERT
jgi:hypothetical protein